MCLLSRNSSNCCGKCKWILRTKTLAPCTVIRVSYCDIESMVMLYDSPGFRIGHSCWDRWSGPCKTFRKGFGHWCRSVVDLCMCLPDRFARSCTG